MKEALPSGAACQEAAKFEAYEEQMHHNIAPSSMNLHMLQEFGMDTDQHGYELSQFDEFDEFD